MAATPRPEFRWGIVLRRSKFNANGSEESTDRQEYEIAHYIRKNNMGIIVQAYKDIASAWKPGAKRPRYEDALVDIASGAIDGIAVLSIDRLVRRKDQLQPILDALDARGGRLLALEYKLDTADDRPGNDTELRLRELVARAERESASTSQRIKLMAKHRARRGLPQPTSNRPFGHTHDWSSLVPEEVELIHEAARRVLEGESIHAICRDWTSRGVSTTTGVTRWSNDKLVYILTSARMVGKRKVEGGLVELIDVPAILPEGLWRQVCAKLTTPESRRRRRTARQLSNIVLCGICGSTLVADVETGTGASVYVCKKRPAAPTACGGINIRAAGADARVDDEVLAFLNDERRVTAMIRQHTTDAAELVAIDERYAELQDRKLAVAVEEAAFSPPPGMERLPRQRYRELRAQIEQEQEQLQRARLTNRELEPLKRAIQQPWTLQRWQATPLDDRRAIIRIATERIEVAAPVRRGARKGQVGERFDPERVKVKLAG
jgi:DNA invertase Pin-like site-specific DNA recombinase